MLAQDGGNRPGAHLELQFTALGIGDADAVGERPRQVAPQRFGQTGFLATPGFPGCERRVAGNDPLQQERFAGHA